MPVAKRDKILLGIGGTLGAGILSWRTMFPWIGYDLKFMKYGRIASNEIKKDIQNGRYIVDMFDEAVSKHPQKPFVIFEDRVYSYGFMDQQANKVANIAAKWGLGVGECVAIMFENEPQFIWTFLGLQKLGIAVAFINFHIKGVSLTHTLKACEAKYLILGKGQNILQNVQEISGDLSALPVFVSGQSEALPEGFQSWDDMILRSEPVPVCSQNRALVKPTTPICYIFTSGTTGLPKPAIITQVKAISIAKFFQLFGFNSSDIIYTCTPLYHSAAGGAGLMGTLDRGATMVLSRKFSATKYFDDVRRYKCTVIQYIGELCRYLLAVPEKPSDGVHNVRVAVGNGLRTDIWDKFKTRYNIPQICEFFGATEGTIAVMNLSNRTGACGRYSPLLNKLDPTPKLLVKFDPESGEPIRDKQGHCIEVAIGETGLLLGGVPALFANLEFYKGSQEINEKKIMRNVLKDGDYFFNFGDLMAVDKDYFVYFKDRIGDTFRWKGENVATYEVSNILTQMTAIQDANVYGVEIQGSEGRAGMAAITLADGVELSPGVLSDIFKHCKELLPSYARPIFLRFPKEESITSTLKQQKVHLRKEGYSPSIIQDPLFYVDEQNQTYVPLTEQSLPQFQAKARL